MCEGKDLKGATHDLFQGTIIPFVLLRLWGTTEKYQSVKSIFS